MGGGAEIEIRLGRQKLLGQPYQLETPNVESWFRDPLEAINNIYWQKKCSTLTRNSSDSKSDNIN